MDRFSDEDRSKILDEARRVVEKTGARWPVVILVRKSATESLLVSVAEDGTLKVVED